MWSWVRAPRWVCGHRCCGRVAAACKYKQASLQQHWRARNRCAHALLSGSNTHTHWVASCRASRGPVCVRGYTTTPHVCVVGAAPLPLICPTCHRNSTPGWLSSADHGMRVRLRCLRQAILLRPTRQTDHRPSRKGYASLGICLRWNRTWCVWLNMGIIAGSADHISPPSSVGRAQGP